MLFWYYMIDLSIISQICPSVFILNFNLGAYPLLVLMASSLAQVIWVLAYHPWGLAQVVRG